MASTAFADFSFGTLVDRRGRRRAGRSAGLHDSGLDSLTTVLMDLHVHG